ncbi:MAG: cobaltochelatase subunit CobN, partial [Rhodospirillaceae bacterium]|nr:cobaltochelatase subunit CobN [Rhodospirillaceae bacterium]
MHLLAALPGEIEDGAAAIDLGQSPADVVVLSASDTEVAALALAQAQLVGDANAATLRLANILHLGHNLSVDLYVENVIAHARLVVVRLLGGRAYWPYGVDEIANACLENNIPVAFVPGDDQADAELQRLSTVPPTEAHALWQYLLHGGPQNATQFLRRASNLIGRDQQFKEPRPLLSAGLYWPGLDAPDLDAVREHWREGLAVVPITFYRALLLSGDLAPIDDLIAALIDAGLNPMPVYVASLKDPVSSATLSELLAQVDAASQTHEMPLGVVVNLTAFAASSPGGARLQTPFDGFELVVLQAVLAGGTVDQWKDGTRGLSPRDIAMHASLPEVDGRILSRAIAFKAITTRDQNTECDVVRFESVPDRVQFVAEQARAWAWARTAPAWSKRIAIVLANYPNRDARLGNGVGLDTPAGVVIALGELSKAGFEVEDIPENGNALIERLKAGPTNAHDVEKIKNAQITFALDDYKEFFESLPDDVQSAITDKWGEPEGDPFFNSGNQSFA